jgi:hypothetical protein
MTVSLIRSFQPGRDEVVQKTRRILVNFEDFAISWILFESVFAQSLHRGSDSSYALRKRLEEVSKEKDGAFNAMDLAAEMKISRDKAYKLLREALDAGVIKRANVAQKNNPKLFRLVPHPEFIPNPARVLKEIPGARGSFNFIHPLNGEPIDRESDL